MGKANGSSYSARSEVWGAEQARQDLTDALKAEPGNKDIRRELANVKAKEVGFAASPFLFFLCVSCMCTCYAQACPPRGV